MYISNVDMTTIKANMVIMSPALSTPSGCDSIYRDKKEINPVDRNQHSLLNKIENKIYTLEIL